MTAQRLDAWGRPWFRWKAPATTGDDVLAALKAAGGKADNRQLAQSLGVCPTLIAIHLSNLTRKKAVKRLEAGHRAKPSIWQALA